MLLMRLKGWKSPGFKGASDTSPGFKGKSVQGSKVQAISPGFKAQVYRVQGYKLRFKGASKRS